MAKKPAKMVLDKALELLLTATGELQTFVDSIPEKADDEAIAKLDEVEDAIHCLAIDAESASAMLYALADELFVLRGVTDNG